MTLEEIRNFLEDEDLDIYLELIQAFGSQEALKDSRYFLNGGIDYERTR